MLTVTVFFKIPLNEIEFSFVRSSGPGGQNVNKVNSKAVLRWNLIASAAVPVFLRVRLLEVLGGKLTREGEILIGCDTSRDQGRNREECLERLREMLLAAATPPKARKKTKPTRSSQRKRLDAKGKVAAKKQGRKKPSFD